MRPFVRLTLTAAVGLSLFPGCALVPRFLRKKPAKPDPSKTFQLVGSISLVNTEDNFVLIDSGTQASPNVDLPAEARAEDGSKTQLHVTAVRRRPFAIADIVSGNPHVGDQVFQQQLNTQVKPLGNAGTPPLR